MSLKRTWETGKDLFIFCWVTFFIIAFIDNSAAEEVGEDSSIIGSFFHFIGEVVSFPFKMLGKGFDAIF